jgi:Type IV secretory pathway, VirD4 components
VFLVLPAKLIPAYSKWFRLMVVSALDALMSTEEKGEKPVLLMLDEFASLGHLSSVENAMGLAAGFGVQLWPFVQDIHQLKDTYKQRWQSFLANAGVQQYFTPADMETAEHISKRAGIYTTKVEGVSVPTAESQGVTRTYNEVGVPLIDPLNVMNITKNQGIIFLAGNKGTLLYARQAYFLWEGYNGRWNENPYFKT